MVSSEPFSKQLSDKSSTSRLSQSFSHEKFVKLLIRAIKYLRLVNFGMSRSSRDSSSHESICNISILGKLLMNLKSIRIFPDNIKHYTWFIASPISKLDIF